ncbi:Type III secretion system inner membrane P protein, partial [mine drainage metagenome]
MEFLSLIRRTVWVVGVFILLWTSLPAPDAAWGSNLSVAPVAQLPELSLKFGSDNGQPSQVAMTVELLLMLTVLSLAPSILIMMTSFTRIIVVLSFLRQAMGTAQVPPNQVMIGLSLFLTFFIMAPVYKTMDDTAITPYLEKRMAPDVALTEAMKPVRSFMMRQVRKKDLALFMKIGHLPATVKSPDD